MRVWYSVPFEDFDYEGWAIQLGLTALLEPDPKGGFILTIEGTSEDVKQFTDESDLKPFKVEH